MEVEDSIISGNRDFGNIKTWTFTETASGLSIVISIYLLLVLKILPIIMSYRQPFKLNRVLTIYNAFQVAYSAYLVFIYAIYTLRHGFITKGCPKSEDLNKVIDSIYPYFIAKHLDLLDTVFFVLRKKSNQITFLHTYHHTVMITWTWFHYFYFPTDNFVVEGMLNSLVHVFMYAYYGIASLGPDYARFLGWKKHLTKIQLVQFILVISHLYFQQLLSPCRLPNLFYYFTVGNIGLFFLLFLKFYFSSYKNKKSKITLETNEEAKLKIK